MRLTKFVVLLTYLVMLSHSVPTLSFADEAATGSRSIAKLKSQFLATEGGTEKGVAARRLFVGRTAQEVQRLCVDENPSVALCAAWHRVEIQMQGRLLGQDRGATHVPIPAELLREFLGFIEGRLMVPAPEAWTKNLLAARYARWGATLFPATQSTTHELNLRDKSDERKDESISLPTVLISLTPPAYATFLGRESYEGQDSVAYLPDKIATLLQSELDLSGSLTVTGLATEGRAVIALPGNGPGFEELVCIVTTGSKANPKVIWQRQMDSYWTEEFKGTSWFTEFRLKDNLLYLFHCTHDSAGIECIKFVDGERVFSFNSRWR